MKIVSLTAGTHGKDRYDVKFEDGSIRKVNTALIADYGLYPGRDMTEEEQEELCLAIGRAEAKSRALRMVGARPMSRREVSDRLREKGVTPEDADGAIEMLQRIGALNDGEYAGMIVRHYAGKGYGLGRIKNELYRRGIPRELWEEALADMPETDAALDRLIDLRLKGRTPDQKELKKVTDMLCRRGFSWEEIRSALARYDAAAGEIADD